MQRSDATAGSVSGSAPSASGASGLGGPRLSGGLSFREVGDWFKNLGDDLGSMVGLPRSRFATRRSPNSASHFDGISGGSASGGTVPRLPSTSLLSKQQQVRCGVGSDCHCWAGFESAAMHGVTVRDTLLFAF